jgi:hypothetical protein
MSTGREHLRELLVTHGVLPERDRYLAAYERWAKARLASIKEPADRNLSSDLRHFLMTPSVRAPLRSPAR